MLINLYLGQFILFFILPIVDSLECKPQFIEPDELVISNLIKHFIIESDSADYTNINEHQFPLTQQLNKVQYDQNAQIINTIIIDSWCKEFILEKQLCSLYKLEGYYITCIFIEGLFQYNGEGEEGIKEGIEVEVGQNQEYQQQFYTFFERFKMPILTQIDENCEFLYQNNLLELSLFCTTLNNLNIYIINQNSLTITKQDYKIELTQIEQCKSKYVEFIENSCLLIFYDCVSWTIYIYKNTLFKLLFNREIAIQMNRSFNINLVENIQICQDNIVLIDDNQQYHFSYRSQNRLIFNFMQKMLFIKQILFDGDCNFKYLLVGSELNNKFSIQNSIYNYELESIPKYVYFVQNLLFLINEDELEVIFNKKFKQKIQLKTFPLQFIEINNIFYQIDQESRVFRFFKYKILNNPILRPTKQFLLFYSYYLQFNNYNPSYCIQLIKKEISYKINNYSFLLNVQCENIEILQIKKDQIQLPDNQKIVIEQDPLNLIDFISDQKPFEQICHTPKKFLKNSKLLFYNENGRTYSIFQTTKFLNILFCDNQQLFQIYIHNQKVINYYDSFILLDSQGNYFRFLQIKHDAQIQREYRFESIIQEALHCSKYVLLFTKSQSLLLFDINLEQYIQLPQILNHILVSIYLANINENDKSKIFSININKNSYFIQYYEHFIVFLNGLLYHYKLKQQQIIQIKQLNHLKDNYQIIAIDINENSLFYYIFNLIHLKLWKKYTFQNSKVILPVAYQEVQEFISIGVIMNNISYTYIFSVSETNQLKLKQTIQINQNHTYMSFKKLYYFDINNEIQVLDLHFIFIQFKPLINKQNNIKLNENLTFYIISESNNSFKVEFNVDLFIFVNCAKLIPLYNEYSIILDEDNHKILHLDNLFEGSIDTLQIQGNQNILLEGPFLSYLLQDELQIQTYTIEQFKINISLTTIQSSSNYKQILNIQVKYGDSLFNDDFGKIISGFYINKYQIILIHTVQSITKAQLFNINQDSLTLLNDSKEFIIQNAYQHQEVIQLGNLFQTRKNPIDIFFYVQNGNIFELSNKNEFDNLILIQNSNQLYLQLKFDSSYHFFIIHTIKIIQMELEIINQFTLDFNKILEDLSKYVFNQFSNEYTFQQIYTINASIINQTLNIKYLIIFLDFSVIQFIQIDQDNGDMNYTCLKIARNPQNKDCKLYFIDENYLILNKEYKYFIYDLRVIKQIYDYTFFYEGNLDKIYPYNTTHYIFYSYINNFTLGQIDYRISILDDQIQNETCTLIAENKISKKQITLQINKISNQNQLMQQKIIQFGIIFFILIIIILILYFIRRFFLIQKLEQSNREFSFLSQ